MIMKAGVPSALELQFESLSSGISIREELDKNQRSSECVLSPVFMLSEYKTYLNKD